MSERQATCAERVGTEFKHEMEKIRNVLKFRYHMECSECVFEGYTNKPTGVCPECGKVSRYTPQLSKRHYLDNLLHVDHVELGTFTDQTEPYTRIQISYGGPSDEFRLFFDGGIAERVEYWFLDWGDGANAELTGMARKHALDLFREIGAAKVEPVTMLLREAMHANG